MKKQLFEYLRTLLIVSLTCISLLQLVACSGDSGSGGGSTGDARVDQFVSALKASGYVVGEGTTVLRSPIPFVNEHVIDSASGNQVNQPYKLLQVPPFPGLSQDPNSSRQTWFPLQPNEAVIYLGPTPPLGDYFSFTPFQWVTLAQPAKVTKGDWTFAALGDPLNHLLIKVEGDGSSPFQKNTMVIFTSDNGVYNSLVNKATAAGFPESMINPYVLPSKLLKMGTTTADDTFMILLRTANIYDSDAANSYLNNDNYARVFRVTPPANTSLTPFDTPTPRNRSATPEENLVPGVTAGLERLKAAIIEKYKSSYASYKPYESKRWFAESRDVLQTTGPKSDLYHKFVAGEASDTTYLRTTEGDNAVNFILGKDDMVIVYGVNHQKTGLALYSNFSVYGETIINPCASEPSPPAYTFGCGNPIWNGVAGMASKDSSNPLYGVNHFTGSAAYFLKPDDNMIPYLYAVRVLRQKPVDSENLPWVVAPEPESGDKPANGIYLNDPVMIGYRAYINKATKSGPSYDDIIKDRSILFKVK